MHEYSIVESIVESMLSSLEKKKAIGVVLVKFKRGSAFSEEAFRQAYKASTQGTLLQDAPVSIDKEDLSYTCACGHSQVIESEDLLGHLYVCPSCGATKEIEEAHDIRLVEFVAQAADD